MLLVDASCSAEAVARRAERKAVFFRGTLVAGGRTGRMIDPLLVNGVVITMDSERRILEDGAVAIHSSRPDSRQKK
jgi:hypothetical protein